MARDFGMPAKVITEILDKYATAPEQHAGAGGTMKLSIVFESI